MQIATKQALEVQGLQEQLVQWKVWLAEGVGEWENASSIMALQMEAEVVQRREEWLLSKVALEWAGRYTVLDLGASAPSGQGICFICIDSRWTGADAWESSPGGGAGGVALKLWWEIVANAEEALLGLAEVLAMSRAKGLTEPTTPVAGLSTICLADIPEASGKGREKGQADLPVASRKRKEKEQVNPLTTSGKAKGKQWADLLLLTKSINTILTQAMVGLNQWLDFINEGIEDTLGEMKSGLVPAEETRFTEMEKMLCQYNIML
ncbi:hypothetical protein E4T56_gene11039 [Termitomyces sp. T112]|nr:hypothetical protein E4T56_gene11039 [Termitomyces sp. T112]